MNAEVIKQLTYQLQATPDLCTWSRLVSALIWERIGFVRYRKGIKITETTVTQNLVFEFWLSAKSRSLPIEIYESKNEKSNGNDFEIFLETPKGFILLPVQCKIISKTDKYNSINHNTAGVDQIDLLLNYAQKKKGIAAYFLYNYFDHWDEIKNIQRIIQFPIEMPVVFKI